MELLQYKGNLSITGVIIGNHQWKFVSETGL